MLFDYARSFGPKKLPLELAVLDSLADGATTVPEIVRVTGADATDVETSLAWAVGKGFLTRMALAEGEHVTLTEDGLAHVAWQRKMRERIGPDGKIDIAGLSRDYGAARQAMHEGQAAERERSQAHVLVDDAEREAAVGALREHYAEGALDHAELERRTALALSARTRGDLGAALEALEPHGGRGTPALGLPGQSSLPKVDTEMVFKVFKYTTSLVFFVFMASLVIRFFF